MAKKSQQSQKPIKKITKKSVKAKSVEKLPLEYVPDQTPIELPPTPKQNKSLQNLVILGLLVLAVAGLYLYRSGYLVAATVNGSPIYRSQLNKLLMDKFGQQSLEMLITEKLIDTEAKNKNVDITEADIAKRRDEMLARIGGGVSLEDLLSFQGMTKDEFNKQVKLQLTVERILEKDIKITDAEIKQFISTSSARLKATQEAQLREEARQIILENRIGEKITSWFNDLKQKAAIKKFI